MKKYIALVLAAVPVSYTHLQETYTEVVKIIRKHGISYFKQPDALVMQIAKRKRTLL